MSCRVNAKKEKVRGSPLMLVNVWYVMFWPTRDATPVKRWMIHLTLEGIIATKIRRTSYSGTSYTPDEHLNTQLDAKNMVWEIVQVSQGCR